MDAIKRCLKNVFPSLDTSVFGLDSHLDEIPDWDSMNSVNLMMELEAVCGVSLFEHDVVLEGRHTLGDVVGFLEQWRTSK